MVDPGFSWGWGGAPTPKVGVLTNLAENSMKMKEFGPPGRVRVPGAPLRSATASEKMQEEHKTFNKLSLRGVLNDPVRLSQKTTSIVIISD